MRFIHVLWLSILLMSMDESLQQTEVKCKRQDYNNAQIIGVRHREYGYGAKVNYVCKDGFTGSFTLTCGQDDWIGDAICEVVKCPPKTVSYADIVGTHKAEYNYGDKVQYDCEGNRGIFFLTCGQNGWEGSQQCREITCNRLNILNTETVGKSKSLYVYKDTVEYSCTGQQQGSFVLTCGREGSWTGSRECKERPPIAPPDTSVHVEGSCSKLPDVPHANVQYKEGDMVHFTCEPGYSSAQDSKYMCTSNGWLTLSQGKCFSCSTLPEVPHAHVSEETKKSDYQLGDVIHFSCESGYASSPAIKYVCSNDGWLAVSQGTCQ